MACREYVMLLRAYIVRAYKKQCSHPRVRARDLTAEDITRTLPWDWNAAWMQNEQHKGALCRLGTHIFTRSPSFSSDVSSLSGEKWPTTLLTETHVGNATPFSIVFPLKTFATALHRYNR